MVKPVTEKVALSYAPMLAAIDKLEQTLLPLSDEALRERASRLGEDADPFAIPDDDYLVEVAALVREAARRSLGMRHYDVQLIAGLSLCRQCIAEMATGEGKTLVASLPAVAYGLHRLGTHVMTVNPYLAERDYESMAPLYQLLGLSVGLLLPQSGPAQKHEAYACDITYGVGSEFGFDYLRDQLALVPAQQQALGQRFRMQLRGQAASSVQMAQRGHHFAVVDEADSVMIDEARSALILSGSSGQPHAHPDIYIRAREIAAQLSQDQHFVLDRKKQSVQLLEAARPVIERSSQSLPSGLVRPWQRYLEQALRAAHLLQRDIQYVVEADKVEIVDEHTGRRLADRSWSDGLHQAVEAQESLQITEESYSMLRISRQRYLGFYQGLCGMTGTASDCAKEIRTIFKLKVQRIPLRKPDQRRMLPCLYFSNGDAKWTAIVDEICRVHASGRPLLVGTRTVADSERLFDQLQALNIHCRILNARQDKQEAEIISAAGQPGQITIATNLAGRGADIPLSPGVAEMGGLYVMATEMHESARVDRQLAGRCARQGEPGSYRLFVSAQDELLQRYASILRFKMARLSRQAEGTQNGALRKDFGPALARLQAHNERRRFKERLELFRHDHWIEELMEKSV